VTRSIDFAPLTTPGTKAEVAAFKASARTRREYARASTTGQVVLLIFGVALIGMFFLFTTRSLFEGISSGMAAGTVILPLVLVGAVVLVVLTRRFLVGGRWARWYRLDRFATANGMLFSPADDDPSYPGSIFASGRSRIALDHFRSATGRFLDYGNYRYVTGSGKSQTTHNWGFLAFNLDRALPHMVLDSRANNGLFGGTNLPTVFAKNQVLHLEGDFDQYFTLYCPKEYERDALYVFTPDLMALLIDNAAPFDVEIIDTWMFVYSSSRLDVTEPAVHDRLLRIVDTVGAKTLTQTDRYVDERVANFSANVVAPQGQRLKRGFSLGAVLVVVIALGIWLAPVVFDAIETISGR